MDSAMKENENMQIAVSNSALMNVEESFLQNAKYFLEKLQEQYPYGSKVDEVDDSYSTEVIYIFFYNHASSFMSDDIIVVTNYRIFSVAKVADFTANNFNVNLHTFMDSIKNVAYKKASIEIQADNGWYIFKSSDEADQKFVTAGKHVDDQILDINRKLVSTRKVATPIPAPVENTTNDESNYDTDSGGFIFVGPKTDDYEYEDMVYVQAQNINWIANAGNFVRAMDKIMSNFSEFVGPDECIFNMRYTTQSMGDTYAVNAVGDLCKKKKQEEKPKE